MSKSTLQTTLNFLRRTKRDRVKQTELIRLMSDRLGYSKESVRGSVIGYEGKLYDHPEFKEGWVTTRKNGPTEIVRRSSDPSLQDDYILDYDTEGKRLARERGLRHVSRSPGRYLTLAGRFGYCVQYIKEKCPNATIFNVEKNPDVLRHWQKQGHASVDFLGTLSDFIHTDLFQGAKFRLANLDMMGYACDYLDKDFQLLNGLRNSKFLVITLQGSRRFRNHGRFVSWAKQKFAGLDPVKSWLTYRLSDYELVDDWFYRRDENRCRPMRMFVLRRGV